MMIATIIEITANTLLAINRIAHQDNPSLKLFLDDPSEYPMFPLIPWIQIHYFARTQHNSLTKTYEKL